MVGEERFADWLQTISSRLPAGSIRSLRLRFFGRNLQWTNCNQWIVSLLVPCSTNLAPFPDRRS